MSTREVTTLCCNIIHCSVLHSAIKTIAETVWIQWHVHNVGATTQMLNHNQLLKDVLQNVRPVWQMEQGWAIQQENSLYSDQTQEFGTASVNQMHHQTVSCHHWECGHTTSYLVLGQPIFGEQPWALVHSLLWELLPTLMKRLTMHAVKILFYLETQSSTCNTN